MPHHRTDPGLEESYDCVRPLEISRSVIRFTDAVAEKGI